MKCGGSKYEIREEEKESRKAGREKNEVGRGSKGGSPREGRAPGVKKSKVWLTEELLPTISISNPQNL